MSLDIAYLHKTCTYSLFWADSPSDNITHSEWITALRVQNHKIAECIDETGTCSLFCQIYEEITSYELIVPRITLPT